MANIQNPKRQVHRARSIVAGEPFPYLIRFKTLNGVTYSAPDWAVRLELTDDFQRREFFALSEVILQGQTLPVWRGVLPGSWTLERLQQTMHVRVERKNVSTGDTYFEMTETIWIDEVIAGDSQNADILDLTLDDRLEVIDLTVDTAVLPMYNPEGAIGVTQAYVDAELALKTDLAYRHQLTNVTHLTITAGQHNRPRISNAMVVDTAGHQLLTNITIDAVANSVTIDSEISINGTILIL